MKILSVSKSWVVAMAFAIVAVTAVKWGWAEGPSFQANILRGNWIVGGAMGYQTASVPYGSTSRTGIYRFKDFWLAPSVQYFFRDRLALGMSLDFSIGHSESAAVLSKNRFFAAGPLLTYFPWVADRMASRLGVAYKRSFSDYNDSEVSFSGGRLMFTAGLDFFLSPSVAFGPSMTYSLNSGDLFPGGPSFGTLFGFALYLE